MLECTSLKCRWASARVFDEPPLTPYADTGSLSQYSYCHSLGVGAGAEVQLLVRPRGQAMLELNALV